MNLSSFDRFAIDYQKGRIIFCEYEPGDTFYLIQKGRVQLTKIIGSIEKTIDILNPNEIFGEMAILEESPRSASAIALDNVRLLAFNRENFQSLMQGTPQIALKLLKLFSKRIFDQSRRLMILKLSNVQARIADVFLMLDEGSPVADENDDSRTFYTTISDIAHWAGISTDEARVVINQFASQRRIEVFNDRIVVHNIHDLARFVTSQRKKEQ